MGPLQPIGQGRAKSSPPSALNWWRTLLQPFLGNIEESSPVCATAVGGSSAIPHMPSASLCHGSLTLGGNECSKRFPPQYYLSFFLNSVFLVLFPTSLSLTPQFFIVLRGGWRFNSTTSPLWLWINVRHADNWQRQEVYPPPLLWIVSLDFSRDCWVAEHVSSAPRHVWCLDTAWSWRVMGDAAYILHDT